MTQLTAQVVRDPAGYAWHDKPKDAESYFVDRHLIGNSRQTTTPSAHDHVMGRESRANAYDPFIEEPALFRIFARLESTEESILDFANKYGDISSLERLDQYCASLLGQWQREIQAMRNAVAVADRFVAKRLADTARSRDTNYRHEARRVTHRLSQVKSDFSPGYVTCPFSTSAPLVSLCGRNSPVGMMC